MTGDWFYYFTSTKDITNEDTSLFICKLIQISDGSRFSHLYADLRDINPFKCEKSNEKINWILFGVLLIQEVKIFDSCPLVSCGVYVGYYSFSIRVGFLWSVLIDFQEVMYGALDI